MLGCISAGRGRAARLPSAALHLSMRARRPVLQAQLQGATGQSRSAAVLRQSLSLYHVRGAEPTL